MAICVFGHSDVSDEYNLSYDCWVTLLKNYLKKENHIFNLGIESETSEGLLKRIEVEAKARNPDIIVVMIGANDSRFNNITKDSVETSEYEFKENIKKIIQICKKFTKKIILIGQIPANESKTTPTIWSKTEYFTNKSLKKYEDLIKEVCKKEKVLFLPLFDSWIKQDYKKLLDKEDGLHPNSKGHKKIFEAVKEFLIQNKSI